MAGATLPHSVVRRARSRHRWAEHGIQTSEPPIRSRPIWALAVLAATLLLALTPLQQAVLQMQRTAGENGSLSPDLLLSSSSGLAKATDAAVASKR